MVDPATALGQGLANRLLADEAWAREKLRVHAGRAASFACGPVRVAYAIGSDGTIEPASADASPPDVEFTISPFDVPRLLADPSRFDTLVMGTGDAALAATIKELAQTLPWFVERAFAKAFGPIVGQRIADTGRRLLQFPEHAGARFGESVASYARDEANLLARGDEGRAFAEQNAALAQRVDAAAERLARIEAAIPK